MNQNLEDKLLKMVDKCETEKSVLNSEISALTRKLVDDQYNINKLNDENVSDTLGVCEQVKYVHSKF